jgi:ElaB/YqjD/DUF883 family membrane-anchored ribosome-binding protein
MEPIGMSIADRRDPAAPITREVDHTASAAHAVIDKASDTMRPTFDRMAGGVHHAVDRFADTATQAAHILDARGAQFADARGRLAEDARHRVRDQPIAALAVALAAGVAVGWLIRHR